MEVCAVVYFTALYSNTVDVMVRSGWVNFYVGTLPVPCIVGIERLQTTIPADGRRTKVHAPFYYIYIIGANYNHF